MNRHISRFTAMVRRWFDRGARDRTLDAELESFLQHDIDARIETVAGGVGLRTGVPLPSTAL